MAHDYATILFSLIMAYQMSAPDYDGLDPASLGKIAYGAVSLLVLLLVPHLSFANLRLGWTLSGTLFCAYAASALLGWRHRGGEGLRVIDGAGAWLALILGGSAPLAIVVGALSGFLLTMAVGPWPPSWRQHARPVEVLLWGAVGIRAWLTALTGQDSWPLLLLMLPWLIAWDVASGGERREELTRR